MLREGEECLPLRCLVLSAVAAWDWTDVMREILKLISCGRCSVGDGVLLQIGESGAGLEGFECPGGEVSCW